MPLTAILAAATIFGLPAACQPGSDATAALVTVHGFKDRQGNLRIAIYRAKEDELLASGRYVQRLDTPLTPTGDMTVCAPVPEAGAYVVTVLHDRDTNGKLSPFRDGVGFSRNPKLGLAKPRVEAVQIRLDGVTPLRIQLNYLQGLKVAPVRSKQSR
jgi:uncharacterized protein (DUF2141 family)